MYRKKIDIKPGDTIPYLDIETIYRYFDVLKHHIVQTIAGFYSASALLAM